MELQESLSFALEATRTGLWTYEERQATVDCDEGVRTVLGAGPGRPMDRHAFLSAFAAEDRGQVEHLLDDPAAALGTAHELELPFRRLDTGVERWIALRARRARGGGVIGSARDVSDTRRYDTQVHLLMREVTHRSKNLLAIIQAMARQTVKDSLSAAEFEARFSARLRGLSFSHELLASQDWRGALLGDLAEGHLHQIVDRHEGRIDIGGPAVFIRPEAAQNIGLALNELASNALRYGALSGETGTVRLQWHIDADETGPQALHMLWTEEGGAPIVSPPVRQGFGHRVMERVVARALDGAVSMTFAPTGLRWSLRIPLSNIASEPGG